MGAARSISRLSALVVALILLACIAVSVAGVVLAVFPRIAATLERVAEKYDAMFPEITIRNGIASIREKQPHFLDNFGEEGLILVVDTRDASPEKALAYLKQGQAGAVLTSETIVTKSNGEVKIISLKDVPDMVLNSANIRDALTKYMPDIMKWAAVFLTAYFLLAKTAQALIMAWVTMLAARLFGASLGYAESVKIAVVCMVIPVVVEFLYNFSEPGITSNVLIYYAVYLVAIVLVVRDLVVSDARTHDDETSGIHPA